jgi:DMSO/TMAO reductase YedYZ molybdopterin-dependent catalytic subunit
MASERTLEELYCDDPERADAVILGRKTGVDRRGFLERSGLVAMGSLVGAGIPFAANMPGGIVPAALAQGQAGGAGSGVGAGSGAGGGAPKGPQPLKFPGKDEGLVVLGDRPLVAETPEHLLDDDTTPTAKFFVRNNGQIPEAAKEPDAWRITVDGEVNGALALALGELKQKFSPVTRRIVLECGGNGRSFFAPQARGNQWTNGGAGCAKWTGVRLSDVLKAAGVKPSAVYTGHFGADPHLSGEPDKQALSRGVPIAKAMDENSLIVWAMNGEPLPAIHGFPVRLLIPGWPGSVSEKWLTRVWVRDKVHDGQGMGGTSYRVPVRPIVPGSNDDGKTFRELESMPVRAIITSPANGTRLDAGTNALSLRGAAWAGDNTVREVAVSIDFGATWHKAQLGAPKNKYDWQRWSASVPLPSGGYYEVWARATDSRGVMQPHAAGNWNPQGYGGNPMHRIAVLVG